MPCVSCCLPTNEAVFFARRVILISLYYTLKRYQVNVCRQIRYLIVMLFDYSKAPFCGHIPDNPRFPICNSRIDPHIFGEWLQGFFRKLGVAKTTFLD